MHELQPRDSQASAHEMKVALYARVSTDQGQTTENQLQDLKAYASRRGWEISTVYQENESAWKAGHQVELARAIADGRHGRFQVLLVWALDRLSREGSLAILSLVDRLGKHGVKIISLQEPWTEAPGELGDVMLAMAGWVARQESIRRSERTKAGLRRLVAEGKKLGRPAGSTDKKQRHRRTTR